MGFNSGFKGLKSPLQLQYKMIREQLKRGKVQRFVWGR